MEIAIKLIERVGVPTALLILLIWRLESKLEALTNAVGALPGHIASEIAKAIVR